MKIVIDIPEEEYNAVMEMPTDYGMLLYKAIRECTPLPKVHGDLADKGDIIHDIDCDEEMRLGKNVEWVREVIRNAPTIIKASEEGAVG